MVSFFYYLKILEFENSGQGSELNCDRYFTVPSILFCLRTLFLKPYYPKSLTLVCIPYNMPCASCCLEQAPNSFPLFPSSCGECWVRDADLWSSVPVYKAQMKE